MLGVGDSVEIPYSLPGPLPAGTYAVGIRGFQMGGDAHLHFDLVHRAVGAPDEPIANGEGYASRSDDGGTPVGLIHAELKGPAIAARCDDELVLRTTFVSGSGSYLEFIADLTIP